MAKSSDNNAADSPRREESTSGGRENFSERDISDSSRDRERLKPDHATINLPDVKDIPGQEHVHVPSPGELADTTISSDDEEGEGIFMDDEEDETKIISGTEDDIPQDDKEALEMSDSILPAGDDERLLKATPDSRDPDGEVLNEKNDLAGYDLDVPGGDEDNANEEIGEEDEENNQYSLGGDRNDN